MLRCIFLAALSASIVGACSSTLKEYKCTASADCIGAAVGRCEASGHCSFSDEACESGFRFGAHSGDESDSCVGEQPGQPDASVDAQPRCVGDGTFGDAVAYRAGATPVSMATGDANDDGLIDLFVANESSDNVSVFLASSAEDGSYESTSNYAAGAQPHSLVVRDFDSDSILDVAVAARSAASVTVMLGTLGGALGPPVVSMAGTEPATVVAADLNSDGILDLATANLLSADVTVLVGTGTSGVGDGNFAAPNAFTVDTGPRGLAVADLDDDGVLDLVTANESAGTTSVLIGTGMGVGGNGGFEAAVNYTAGTTPHAVVPVDLNGDGNLDLVVANLGDDTLTVLRGAGDGTFTLEDTIRVGGQPHHISAADFDDDGAMDLAISNKGEATVGVLLGRGDFQFLARVDYPVGDAPQFVLTEDLNGDGVPDLATANGTSDDISVLHANVVCD